MTASPIASRLANRLGWEDLDPVALRKLVSLARQEDLEGWGLVSPPAHRGDVTSMVIENRDSSGTADLVAREPLVLCGSGLVPIILDVYGNEAVFRPVARDGQALAAGDRIGRIEGPAPLILQAERVLLNFLQRLSGVATLTREYVDALGNSPTRLLDTRKTTPGFRMLEKYAVASGGGFNHRLGLFDRVMLKDNHLAAASASRGNALSSLVRASRERWPDLIVELEVDAIGQIPPALEAGVEVLLLDNFALPQLREAVSLVAGRAATEASGRVTLQDLPELGKVGLDFISTGATIHKAVWKDIGLDWN